MPTAPRFGIGFRTQHFAELLRSPRAVDWLELLSDNYLGVGGPRRAMLEALRRDHPVALHGVQLGIANDRMPSPGYLSVLRALADWLQPEFVSDHLCWTGVGGCTSHDLLPIAYTREVLALVVDRVECVQDALGRRLLLENASAYVKFRADELGEGEFLAALCERTGCGVLLDVNNLFVNARNLGADAHSTLAALSPRHVGYLHVAGHTALPDVCIDTHGAPVVEEVWRLFREVARRFPQADVILERDGDVPALDTLRAELDLARVHWRAGPTASDGAAPPLSTGGVEPAARTAPPVGWCATRLAFWEHATGCREAPDAPATQRLEESLDPGRPVAAPRGLRVYRDAYASTLERALATNFPALARVLSRRDFSALCRAFAAAHPPRSHDFVRFGAALADFLGSFAFRDRYEADGCAFADLARLEQAQLEVQEAPDESAPFSTQSLAALEDWEWERARFEFVRAHRVLRTRHDVLPAVQAVARGERPPRPARASTAYLVSRRDGGVVVERIDPAGACALEALAAGECFEGACAWAGGEAAAPAAAAALAIACARGLVRGRLPVASATPSRDEPGPGSQPGR
jgi:hypothetical protein